MYGGQSSIIRKYPTHHLAKILKKPKMRIFFQKQPKTAATIRQKEVY